MEGGLVAQQVGVKSSSRPSGCPPRDAAHGCTAPADGNSITTSQYYQCIIQSSASNSNTYCEYRDVAALLPSNDWRDTAAVQEQRQKRVYITINATTGGNYGVLREGANSLTAHLNGNAQASFVTYPVNTGETGAIELRVYGRGNYRKGGNEDGVIYILPPGSQDKSEALASCTILVQDDDNSAYAGRRKLHPYGATWRGNPTLL